MKNFTPKHLQCAMSMSCPAVYQLDDGRLMIVGKIPTLSEGMEVQPPVGADESIVIIDLALLANVPR